MWKRLRELVQAPAEPAGPPPDASAGLLDALWAQALPPEEARQHNHGRIVLREHPAGREMLALDGRSQASLVVQALRRQMDLTLGAARSYHIKNQMAALPKVAAQLLRRDPDFQEEQLVALAETAVRAGRYRIGDLPMPALLRAFENHARTQGLGAPLREALTSLVRVLETASLYKELAQTLEGLRRILRDEPPPEPGLAGGDAWSDELLDALGRLPSGEQAAWRDLLAHCATATSAKPSSRWLARAKELAGRLDLAPVLASCLDRIGEPGSGRVKTFMGQQIEVDRTLLDDAQTDLLRGLVWCAGFVDDPTVAPSVAATVGKAADACFRKVENHGPRNAKVGNACLETLSRMGTPAAVAQLSRLRTRVRHPSSRRQLEGVLDKVAERQGLTKAELEEMSVPTQGLTEVGLRREDLGGFTAELRVTGTSATELTWRKEGKTQKSVPKAVQEGHAAELKPLTAAAKEIQKVLPGHRDRLERLYLIPRDWDLATWRERYLDHPLVGTLARRLIWKLGDRTGLWREGRLVDAEGQPLDLPEDVRVTLWHPLDSAADEVLAWRTRLEAWEVVQPFKQAHREIYLLTDAERQTATYSNRFAAHILKQHQLAELCKQRGWAYSLQGEFDSHATPTLEVPERGLRVEFWVEPASEEISGAGIYLYVSTDQVRFSSLSGTLQTLEQVPPLLFSELMRDVDLFVGVCSIGNDPNWGQDRHDVDHWNRLAFGELGEGARARRELLGRLLPRLKIADRCVLADRFLVVRGDRRTYKIHLGSGNILMEPNDQYLCVVADRSRRAERTVLPFEGDGILALILSKAFLLADDTRITDPKILSQLGR